jgi:hypothetical protein
VAATGPVSDMLKPILIGSAAAARTASIAVAATSNTNVASLTNMPYDRSLASIRASLAALERSAVSITCPKRRRRS